MFGRSWLYVHQIVEGILIEAIQNSFVVQIFVVFLLFLVFYFWSCILGLLFLIKYFVLRFFFPSLLLLVFLFLIFYSSHLFWDFFVLVFWYIKCVIYVGFDFVMDETNVYVIEHIGRVFENICIIKTL